MIPLFGAIPGGPELAVIGLVGLLGPLVAFGAAYWVHGDARDRSTVNEDLWTVGVALAGTAGNLLGLIVMLGLYLVLARE